MVFDNATTLGFASLLQVKSVPLERGKSSVCWDLLLTGRMGLGLRPLLSGDSPVLWAGTGNVQQRLGFSTGCSWTLQMPRYENAEVRWSGPRVLCCACRGAPALLVEKEPQHSVPLLLGAEAPQCRQGQRGWGGEQCWQTRLSRGKRAWQWSQRSPVLVAPSARRRASLTPSCSYEELLDFLK